ncbi:MAG: ABC transporter substrate-binding protein [Candidatus Bathyarchaeia archaeon]
MRKKYYALSMILILVSVPLIAPLASAYYPETQGPPFFKITVMIPNNVQSRMIWSTTICIEWSKIGIDVKYTYVPWSIIQPRRVATPLGKTYDEGGWDVYTERYYYDTITPNPGQLFHSSQMPPTGTNYGLVNSTQLDQIIDNYASAVTESDRLYWINEFQKWWLEWEPMPIVYYPVDIVAINPNLQGFEIRDGSTYNWLFYPHPEFWTIPGKTKAAFAVWKPEPPLLPQHSIGYDKSDVFGPVHNRLFEYWGWNNKTLVPALAVNYTVSSDGKTWVVNLRQGVTWHDGWPFNASDVKFTFDLIMNETYGAMQTQAVKKVLGSPDNVEITGEYQVTFHLPNYTIFMKEYILSSIHILPWHAYKDLGPEDIGYGGLHPANTWEGTYTVKMPNGTDYVAHGPIGTGPWIAMGYDPVKKSFNYIRNHNYWMDTPGNIEEFSIVMIEGAAAVLAALKNGEIDAFDTMYSIETLVPTIDPSWGKVITSDSYKWQHVIINMKHPVLGTGVDTPLGRQDPSRAAEAAKYVRKALSYAIPRQAIIQEVLNKFGVPGTVPIPYTSIEYNHTLLQPIEYNLTKAKEYMEMAGYRYEAEEKAPSFLEAYGLYIGALIAVVVIVVAVAVVVRRGKKIK